MKAETRIAGKQVQITRVFQAPRTAVFAYWTEADKLQRWSGCKEATKCEIEMDFRVGGCFTQKMHMGAAGDFTITGRYLEIVEPERIVYEAVLGPFATTRVTVEFLEQGGQTRLVLTHTGLPDENICGFVTQGTGESFDKLTVLLAGQGTHA
jgi:uncharacterized protein YndB with AHSA1/START domain